MASLLKKIDTAMKRAFEESGTELQRFLPGSSVGGYLEWRGFAGMSMRDRVRRVWDVLEHELGPSELRRVSIIMPFTPAEMRFRREQLAADETEFQRGARVNAS